MSKRAYQTRYRPRAPAGRARRRSINCSIRRLLHRRGFGHLPSGRRPPAPTTPPNEVLVRGRSLDGQPGAWILTPLVTGDGTAVVVNRGGSPIPACPSTPPPRPPRRPARSPSPACCCRPRPGPLRPDRSRRRPPRRPEPGRPRPPAGAGALRPVSRHGSRRPAPSRLVGRATRCRCRPPRLDEGPHLSYAVQWFAFSPSPSSATR